MLGPNDHCTIPTRNETRGQDRLQTRIVLLPDWHVVTAVEQIREVLAAIRAVLSRPEAVRPSSAAWSMLFGSHSAGRRKLR